MKTQYRLNTIFLLAFIALVFALHNPGTARAAGDRFVAPDHHDEGDVLNSVSVFKAQISVTPMVVDDTVVLITEYILPNENSRPIHIASGPDGNIWFTERTGEESHIGRITEDGTITMFPVPTPSLHLRSIILGPDGNLWFAEFDQFAYESKIAKMTLAGIITEFEVPTANSYIVYITTGPDGALWFTENNNRQIGRITTNGTVTEFPLSSSFSQPTYIVAGPDGALWFTASGCNAQGRLVGRITTLGDITEFPIADTDCGVFGGAIAVGPNDNLWLIVPNEFSTDNKIVELTTSGNSTLFGGGGAASLIYGPDSNLWFVDYDGYIGQMTPDGMITLYPIPTSDGYPFDLTSGPDGALWFTELEGHRIGKLTMGVKPVFLPLIVDG